MTKPRMLAILAVLLLAGAGLVWAQAPTPQTSSDHATSSMAGCMMGGSAMMGTRGSAMDWSRDLALQTSAPDARLDDLVEAMNRAHGERKIDAVAAVVTELAAERKAMNRSLTSMEPGMMMRRMHNMPTESRHGTSGWMRNGMTTFDQDDSGGRRSHR